MYKKNEANTPSLCKKSYANEDDLENFAAELISKDECRVYERGSVYMTTANPDPDFYVVLELRDTYAGTECTYPGVVCTNVQLDMLQAAQLALLIKKPVMHINGFHIDPDYAAELLAKEEEKWAEL